MFLALQRKSKCKHQTTKDKQNEYGTDDAKGLFVLSDIGSGVACKGQDVVYRRNLFELALKQRGSRCFLQGGGTLSKVEKFGDSSYVSDIDKSELADLYVTCQLFSDNKPLCPPVQTAYRSCGATYTWNEWLTIPIKYRDLPITAQLAITVWYPWAPKDTKPLGGTTFPLFGKNNTLRKGQHKLLLWSNTEADGRTSSTTPYKTGQSLTEMDRIENLMRKYERGDIDRIEWLDYMAFREIEKINKSECETSQRTYLYIDLPIFDFPLLFSEKEPVASLPPLRALQAEFFNLSDPEALRDNPVENKHRKLTRSHRNGPLDRELKPNAKIRDELNKILKYSPTQPLTSEEKDLLWKFRYYLTRDKKALTKFLKSVEWSDVIESKQAIELLSAWVDIDMEDALELLGPSFMDSHTAVRRFAVGCLTKADDEELLMYLGQLVQGVKFGDFGKEKNGRREVDGGDRDHEDEEEEISNSPAVLSEKNVRSSLVEFLIHRAVNNPILGNYFYWYLVVECDDQTSSNTTGKMYSKILMQFLTAMAEGPDGMQRREMLQRQGELVNALSALSKDLRLMKDARPKKIEKLRANISDPKHNLLTFPPFPLPLDANIQITGLIPDKSSVFKSALFPLKLTFTTHDGPEYPIIFKTGDDLRQDQLVIQLITLMDGLLRKENLDLKLTPYKVLATGANHGMIQFVPSLPLAVVLSEYNGNLLNFLRKYHPDTNGPFGVAKEVMENYIRSCAGYCVITYLLGVGDRHLDNLLLTTSGHLFHIDFGFILGRDPKPFPPPMKLCKEMVEAMGGTSSHLFTRFKSYCFTSFSLLRKSSNLILNLFALMSSANVPDIALEPDKAVHKVQEKFRLDLEEEEAIQYFQALINESVSALFPQVIEKIHSWAQYWRK